MGSVASMHLRSVNAEYLQYTREYLQHQLQCAPSLPVVAKYWVIPLTIQDNLVHHTT